MTDESRDPAASSLREEKIAKILRDNGLTTFTFEPQPSLYDWGNTGVTTAATVPEVNDKALRVSRTFSITRESDLSGETDRASGDEIRPWVADETMHRRQPVLWDAVSTSWPVPAPSPSLLSEFLRAHVEYLRANPDSGAILRAKPADIRIVPDTLVVDGVYRECVSLQGDDTWFAKCLGVSDDRLILVSLPQWAADQLIVRIVSDRSTNGGSR